VFAIRLFNDAKDGDAFLFPLLDCNARVSHSRYLFVCSEARWMTLRCWHIKSVTMAPRPNNAMQQFCCCTIKMNNRQTWSCLHCGLPRVADEMRCSSHWSTKGKGSEGVGSAGCKPEIWRGTVSSKKPSRAHRILAVAAPHPGDFWNPFLARL